MCLASSSPCNNSIDGMAGPHGEYGLYNRIMAGWVGGSQRRLLTQDDLAQPGSQHLVLWPFDRCALEVGMEMGGHAGIRCVLLS